LSYNVQLTTPKANVVVKLVVPIITIRSTLTCTNCGKFVIQWKLVITRKERY
jgi:hypothetical protein